MTQDIPEIGDKRHKEISSLLASYSNGDFDAKGEVSTRFDALDTIISGINTLGEEIKESTVSRDFMSSVYKAVQDFLFTLDLDGKVTDCNVSAEIGLGRTRTDLLGTEIEALISFASENKSLYTAIFNDRSINQELSGLEGTFKNATGHSRHVVCDISCLKNLTTMPNGYLLLIRDVTNKKLADHILLRAMVSTLEQERKRVANDLHDSIGQELAGLRIILSHLLKVSCDSHVIKKEEMDTCISLIDGTIQGLRDVCYNLLPSSLVNEGLMSALRELKRRLPSEIELDFNPHPIMSAFPLSLQVDLFRIIQEFISNSLKHARADTISIAFNEIEAGSVEMILNDDGVGFDPAESNHGGRGFYTIESRAKTFNGTVSITSKRGQGTNLRIAFNLETYEEYSTFDRG